MEGPPGVWKEETGNIKKWGSLNQPSGLLATFLRLSGSTCFRMPLTTMGWVLLHQLYINKMTL